MLTAVNHNFHVCNICTSHQKYRRPSLTIPTSANYFISLLFYLAVWLHHLLHIGLQPQTVTFSPSFLVLSSVNWQVMSPPRPPPIRIHIQRSNTKGEKAIKLCQSQLKTSVLRIFPCTPVGIWVQNINQVYSE